MCFYYKDLLKTRGLHLHLDGLQGTWLHCTPAMFANVWTTIWEMEVKPAKRWRFLFKTRSLKHEKTYKNIAILMMQETMEKQRRKFIRFLLLFDETRLKLLGYVSGCIQTRMNKQSNTPNKILHLNLCLERDLRCSELDKGFVHESCT